MYYFEKYVEKPSTRFSLFLLRGYLSGPISLVCCDYVSPQLQNSSDNASFPLPGSLPFPGTIPLPLSGSLPSLSPLSLLLPGNNIRFNLYFKPYHGFYL